MKKVTLFLALALVPMLIAYGSKNGVGDSGNEIADKDHHGGHHGHHKHHEEQHANYVPYYYPPIIFQPEIQPAAPVYYQPIQIYNPPSETLYNTPPTIPTYAPQGPPSASALNRSICSAIENLERLQMIVEEVETISKKERKVVVKKLIVEPYAFGVTKEKKPIFRGHIVEEKIVKEMTEKYPEDLFDETIDVSKRKEMFGSDKSTNIDVRKIIQIKVLVNTHFDAPKDYKGINDDNIEVICQLPVAVF